MSARLVPENRAGALELRLAADRAAAHPGAAGLRPRRGTAGHGLRLRTCRRGAFGVSCADPHIQAEGAWRMSDDLEAARRSSQSWYWWGIPTFFRCPWNEDPAAGRHRPRRRAAQFRQWLDRARPASGSARRAQCLGLLSPQPLRPWLRAVGCGAHQRPGRRAAARGDEQRGLRARHRGLLPPARRGGHAAGLDRRRSLDHGTDPQGHCRAGAQAVGRQALRAHPFRCAHRFLRQHAPLAGRQALGGALGGLHGEGRGRRSGAQRAARHARPSLGRDPQGRRRRVEPRARLSRRHHAGVRGARRRAAPWS